MLIIKCDKCGKEISALSNKPNKEKNTGIGFKNKHLCSDCIDKVLNKKDE